MAKRRGEHAVVTASRLRDGVVVWWAGSSWVERFAEAAALEGAAVDAALDLARQDEARQVVVDVHAAEIAGGALLTFKERIRAEGPTVPLPQEIAYGHE